MHIAIIWQRFLPYHLARIRHLDRACKARGWRLTPIEVASQDATYGFSQAEMGGLECHCCFPNTSYHEQTKREVHGRVYAELCRLMPDVVFAPATPFPEGMAAVHYRMDSGCKSVMMDDAWEVTDQKQGVARRIKQMIHKNVDAVFVPAPSHASYFYSMGFPRDRIVFGVDVVDNDYYAHQATCAREDSNHTLKCMALPQNYFLFVGRFLPRKGIESLVEAYQHYRQEVGNPWSLVLVGDGEYRSVIERLAAGVEGIQFAGRMYGDTLAACYGLANALVVPSLIDPWGLVVNEGMAAGLPVLVSQGCGSATTLVDEGKNGWSFPSGDSASLAQYMVNLSSLTVDARKQMGIRSSEIIFNWSPDRFVEGAFEAINLPRRAKAGAISDFVSRLWKGRISVN